MARADEIVLAIHFQLGKFLETVTATYTGNASDVNDTAIFQLIDFDTEDEESFSALLGYSNYSFVFTNIENEMSTDYPHGYLKQTYSCDIVVIRKTLKTIDRTNDYNLLHSGGQTGSGATITSMSRLCTDLQKWFRSNYNACKLYDDTNYNAVKSDIVSISPINKTGNFYYKICKFQALTLESTTITAN